MITVEIFKNCRRSRSGARFDCVRCKSRGRRRMKVTVPCSNQIKPPTFLAEKTYRPSGCSHGSSVYTHWQRFYLKHRHKLAVFRLPGLYSALTKSRFWETKSSLVFRGIRTDFVSVGRCLVTRQIDAKHLLCRHQSDL